MEQKIIDKKKVILIVSAVIAVVLAVYFGFSVYFMNHFYFGTKIGSVDVSGKSAVAADQALQNAMHEYELVIKERDGSSTSIVGDEIDLKVEWNTNPEHYIQKQNGFAWVLKLFRPDLHEVEGKILYDEAKLMEKIKALPAMGEEKQVAAMDAKVSEYNEKEGYTILPSVPGTVVDVAQLTTNVKTCISTLSKSLDMTEGDSYVQPKITEDNEALIAAVEQLNKSLNTVITYQVGASTEVLDASIFHKWLYVDENLKAAVKDEALTDYVKGLESSYNTYYSAKNFMTSYGKEIKITNSRYGWKVNNDAEKAMIIENIMAGVPVSRELNYSVKANSHDGNDYGNSYVEINLTAQHLFVYVDGQVVVESDFVSGNKKNRWDTPTGIWGLTYKTQDAVLRGDNYATPVKYWMPYAGNVGMHDATWRDDFGGSIYKRDGSHGCINLPKSKAKQIYEYVHKGFPVIVYHLEGTESEKGIAQDQAYAMSEAIKKIGKVTLSSETAIVACRQQYDGLSELAKKYVTNYQVLLKAEEALETLKVNSAQ